MQERQIIKLTELLHSNYKLTAGNVMLSCPNASHSNAHKGTDNSPSFGISISDTKSKCNCFACGIGGDLSTVFAYLFSENRITEEAYEFAISAERGDIASIIASFSVVAKEKQSYYPDYVAMTKCRMGDPYFIYRGVSAGEIHRFRLGYDVGKNMVIFPYISFYTKEVVGASGRTTSNPKGCYFYPSKDSSVLFGEQLVDSARHDLILVEGQLDVIAFSRVYPNVVCLSGLMLPQKQLERILSFSEVITLAFDNDQAGWNGVDKIGSRLSKRTRVFVVSLPPGKDPDASTTLELEEAYAHKKIF